MNEVTDIPAFDREAGSPESWTAANWRVLQLGLEWLGRLAEAARGPDAAIPPTGEGIHVARADYDAERDRLSNSGMPAAIDRLSAAFRLSPFEEDICLLALAARLDAAYPALLGAVTGGGPSHPSLDLALRLFTGLCGEAAVAAHLRLGPSAPLRWFGLLVVPEGAGLDGLSPLVLDESIARYLIGDGGLDTRVGWLLAPLPALPLARPHRQAAEALAQRLREPGGGAELCGPQRCGRRAVAVEAAARLGLMALELRPLRPDADPALLRSILVGVSRAARLHGLFIVIDAGRFRRSAAPDNREAGTEALAAMVSGLDCPLAVLEEEPRANRLDLPSLAVPPLGDRDRLELWREAVAPAGDVDEALLADLSAQFAIGPADIAQTAATVAGHDRRTLWAACRERSRQAVEELGERIVPRAGWADIVLPDAVLADLKAIAAQARHRVTVYDRWGFADRLVRNIGVTAMFAGPSGVGKTMAAEVIGRDLQLDLIRIDLSGVVSKYIGETEKNLKRVFDAAERSGAVLFFDEADALFGKRSEVKDSHDRYANIEVSYLLQRMECYAGLAILATNMKAHIDPAFLRRLRYVVDLPFPTSELRREIWRRAFPPAAPVCGLDFDMLARLEIAGGNIMVIAVNAAFLAAEDGRAIDMGHVVRAARAEFRKIDREFRLPWAGGGAA